MRFSVAAGQVFISGQLPLQPDGTPMTAHSFGKQTAQVLKNIDACLARTGVDRNSLVQVRVHITDIRIRPAFNRLYAECLDGHRPVRAVTGVSELPFGLAVEVEAVAVLETISDQER